MGDGKIVKITGIRDMRRTATNLVCRSNQLAIDEVEGSLLDALCVVGCLVNKKSLIADGGAPGVELLMRLGLWAKVLQGIKSYCVWSFAQAFGVIPCTLGENAGLNSIVIVTELRNHHALGDKIAGSIQGRGRSQISRGRMWCSHFW